MAKSFFFLKNFNIKHIESKKVQNSKSEPRKVSRLCTLLHVFWAFFGNIIGFYSIVYYMNALRGMQMHL
jgi:hypothetical protein